MECKKIEIGQEWNNFLNFIFLINKNGERVDRGLLIQLWRMVL